MRICPQCSARFDESVSYCPNDGVATREDESAAAPAADPYIGRVVDGRYRIESLLGEGGMGVVYRISHAVLGKRMALKVLRGEMSRDPEVVQRFIQEAQSATQIGHPNIIDISDFGQMPDGSAYFVMEFLEGQSLTNLIARGGSIPSQTAIHIVRQIASALGAAHEHQVVHRDLKPDNVSIVRQGDDPYFVKVLDFGIAKVGGASSKLTKTGMIFGTPHYMSPEQASGQSVDRRTDIYALGVIMYEMFVGRVPFDSDTFMGILSKHMFEEPISPSQASGVSLGVIEDVILKALAKRAEQRFQTMDEFVEAIDSVVATGSLPRSMGIAPPTNLADALEPPSRTEMRLGMTQDLKLPVRSRAPLYITLALLSIAVVATAGYFVAGSWLEGGGMATAATTAGAPAGTEGADPAQPTQPTQPTEPAQPAQPTEPAQPAQPTEPAQPAQPTEPVGVRPVAIVSEPPGADVLLDDLVIGQTPATVPAPASGERQLTLRLRGHEDARVVLLPTSGERVEVRLQATQPASGAGRAGDTRATRGSGAGRSAGEATTATTETTMTEATMTTTPPEATMVQPRSEVVDPWNLK